MIEEDVLRSFVKTLVITTFIAKKKMTNPMVGANRSVGNGKRSEFWRLVVVLKLHENRCL